MTQVEPRPGLAPRVALSRTEAEEFIYREVGLLDQGRHDEWLELFAENGVFWVPCNDLDNDPTRHVSLIYDDREALGLRVQRLQMGRTVQEIPSRTLHLVGNVTLEPAGDDPDLVGVLAAMTLYEVHGRRNESHPAHCRYVLRRDGDGGWRIVLKKIAFLANDQFIENLAFLF